MKLSMNRRSFLLSGSAAVATLSLPRFAFAGTAGSWPLGYLVGSGDVRRRGNAIAHFVDAHAMSRGDADLRNDGARFRVLKYFSAGTQEQDVEVLAQFKTAAGVAPFHAWSRRSIGRQVTESSPVGFTMPLDSTSAEMIVRVGELARAVRFSPLNEQDSILLRRGLYVIALTDAPVDWNFLIPNSRVSLEDVRTSSESFVLEPALSQNLPPSFAYVLLEVGSARTSGRRQQASTAAVDDLPPG